MKRLSFFLSLFVMINISSAYAGGYIDDWAGKPYLKNKNDKDYILSSESYRLSEDEKIRIKKTFQILSFIVLIIALCILLFKKNKGGQGINIRLFLCGFLIAVILCGIIAFGVEVIKN